MVDEITPTYYAPGQQLTYTLVGFGFDSLPANIVGVRASENLSPLHSQYSDIQTRLYDMTERSNTRIVLSVRQPSNFTTNGYLGGILSNERNIVYWVNNSQPLPTNRDDIVNPEFIDER